MFERKLKTWQRALAYAAFALFSLTMGFFLTFPYEALQERVRNEADAAGYFVRVGSMGAGLMSVRAKNIELSKKSTGAAEEKPPESLHIDSVSVGPMFFPPGIAVTAKLLDGTARLKVSGVSSVAVKV